MTNRSTLFDHLPEDLIDPREIHTTQIFLSYARCDNRQPPDYVALRTDDPITALQAKLDRMGFPMWRDTHDIYGGEGWWEQIQAAIEASDALVICLSPNWLASDIARKERLYAMQLGKPVLPVMIADLPADAPAWVNEEHYHEVRAHNPYAQNEWDKFLRALANPQPRAKVAFMVENLHADFVERPDVFDPLLQALISPEKKTVSITTALRGAGGYGKTTIARALCHAPQVREHYRGGVLWVQLREDAGESEVLYQTQQVIKALHGDAPSMTTYEDARKAIREAIGDRRVLVVVDDAWTAGVLYPFLDVGPNAATLVTTRIGAILPQEAVRQVVDAMTPHQSREMLTYALSADSHAAALDALATRLGRWALLLKLANKQLFELVGMQMPLDEAIRAVNEALDEEGLAALDDPNNPKARYQAAASCLNVTLRFMNDAEKLNFARLAIFPEDTDIPLETAGRAWGTNKLKTLGAVRRLNELSLLAQADLGRGIIRLHDIVRQYLREQHADSLAVWQREFVAALGDSLTLPDLYAWRHYAYHLIEAGQRDTLRALLLDYRWLQAKLDATDANALIADCDTYLAPLTPQPPLPQGARGSSESAGEGEQSVRLLKSALTMSGHILNEDKTALAHQLVGRLMTWRRDEPEILKLTETIMENVPGIYPAFPDSDYAVLNQAGGPLIRTLAGHTDEVNHVALASDGRTAVSASHDNTLRVWDVATGETRHILRGHMDTVNHVALTNDGRSAVSASGDTLRINNPGELIVWDIQTGDRRHILKGHTECVRHVVLTGDGRIAISASSDKTLIVWDIQTGKALHILKGHTDVVRRVALTTDGRTAVSASWDNTLRVWDIQTGKQRHVLNGHTTWVYHVAVTDDGYTAVSASSDNRLIVWDIQTGKARHTLNGHTDWVYHVALTDDGQTAVSASGDKTLIVWDIQMGKALHILKGHKSSVNYVALTEDGWMAVSASNDNTLIAWDITTGEALHVFNGHTLGVSHVVLTEDRRIAVSASKDKTLIVWDLSLLHGLLQKREMHPVLKGHISSVRCVALTGDGQTAVSASDDNTLTVWDVQTGERRHILKGHTDIVYHVVLTEDGETAISASEDNTLIVWNVLRGEVRHVLRGHTRGVNHVALTGDGLTAVSASYDKTLIVWNIETGEVRYVLQQSILSMTRVVFINDGQKFVAISDNFWDKSDEFIAVWDVEQGTQLGQFSRDKAGLKALQREFPEAWAVYQDSLKVRPNNEDWGINRDDTRLTVVDANGVARAVFTGDANILSADWAEDGWSIVAGDKAGRVLFLRVRGVF